MKKMLVTAMAFAAVASSALAQQTQTIAPLTLPNEGRSPIGPGNGGLSVAADPTAYFWDYNLFRRFGPDGDTNRRDLTVPQNFGGGFEFRGFGEVFNPKVLYQYFNGSVYSDATSYVSSTSEDFATDQEYIDQFKGATSFTVDAMSIPLFKNPNSVGTPENSGILSIYKTSFNFGGASYRSSGFRAARESSTLTQMEEYELDGTALDTTIDLENSTVNSTIFTFDPPLEFANGESMITLYTNDFAEAVDQPVGGTDDTREWQRVIASEAYREGGFNSDDPDNVIDERTNPIDMYKTMGLVMFRNNEKDTIYSAWTALQFGSGSTARRAIIDINTRYSGTVLLASGVKYYYGKDATSQGIGAVTPNPVRESAVIPFSLTERADVKLDLYSATGAYVKSLHTGHYIAGPYSFEFSTEGLASGTYLVRMTAGDKAYSTKINVVK